MTILVTGSTGTIGSQVVQRLAGQGARVRALVRGDASKAKLPAGVEPIQGDMTDVASMRTVLKGVDTLFLLNAVAADEVTQALGTIDLAREAGIASLQEPSTPMYRRGGSKSSRGVAAFRSQMAENGHYHGNRYRRGR
jgi:uncharacterized protein YbjT (DUF2867 family)